MQNTGRLNHQTRSQLGRGKGGIVVNCRNHARTHRPGARISLLCRAELKATQKGAAERKTVVALGESLFDLIADQQGLSRDKVRSWTPFAGGAPANVATSLGKLGLDALIVTALGKDEPGDKLYKLFEESGVRLTAVQRRDEPTRDVYVTRDLQGDREFAGFGRPSPEYCDAFIDANHLPIDEIKSAAFLITGTLGLAYPATRGAIMRAVQAAKEGGCKVLVDVNWRPVFWEDHAVAKVEISEYLQQADLIKISDSDLVWLLDTPMEQALLNPASVAEYFPKAQGVLITCGENGAAYCFRRGDGTEYSGFVPVFKLNAVDTTGAGDAFTAGFIYKALQAGSLEALMADPKLLKEAMVFGSATGALTCTRKGAIEGQPSLKDVEQLFEQSKAWYNFW